MASTAGNLRVRNLLWPFALLILSMWATLASPTLTSNLTGGLFGFTSSAVVSAA